MLNFAPQNTQALLIEAIYSNNPVLLRTCVQAGANVNATNEEGKTPLHFAAQLGHVDMIEVLCKEFNVNKEAADNEGRTAVHYAIRFNKPEALKKCSEIGCDLNKKTTKGFTPLSYAAIYNQADIIRILINELHVDKNQKNTQGDSVLINAISNLQEEIVKMLVSEFGLNINEPCHAGLMPMHYAVLTDNESMIKLVHQLGADKESLDNTRRTPLHQAAYANKKTAIRVLLKDLKVNINPKDGEGGLPIHLAAMKGRTDVVDMLMAEGGNIEVKNTNGFTPMHYAALGNQSVMLQHLASKCHANTESLDNLQRTPLYQAAGTTKINAVRTLINDLKVNKNPKDVSGCSPLHICVIEQQKEMIELLVKEFKADIEEQDNEKNTLMHYAANGGNEEMVTCLNKLGAKIDPLNRENKTPLHLAVATRKIACAEKLLALKADIHAKDKDGHTPMHFAAINNHVVMLRTLMRFGASVDSVNNMNRSALHLAAALGCIDSINLLIRDLKADVNKVDTKLVTPLFFAAFHNQTRAADVLIKKYNANVMLKNMANEYPIHWAVLNNNIEMVNAIIPKMDAQILKELQPVLLQLACIKKSKEMLHCLVKTHQFDVNAKSQSEQTASALHEAVEQKWMEGVEYLVRELGADVNAKDADGNIELFNEAIADDLEMIKLLISLGSDITVANCRNETLFHMIAARGSEETANYLKDAGIKFDSKADHGLTPMHYAALNDNVAVLKVLGESCKEVKDDCQRTPLFQACAAGSVNAIRTLINELKADQHTLDVENNTVLHVAVIKNQMEVVEVLVNEFGLDIHALNIARMTAADYARSNGNNEILSILTGESNNNNVSNATANDPLFNPAPTFTVDYPRQTNTSPVEGVVVTGTDEDKIAIKKYKTTI